MRTKFAILLIGAFVLAIPVSAEECTTTQVWVVDQPAGYREVLVVEYEYIPEQGHWETHWECGLDGCVEYEVWVVDQPARWVQILTTRLVWYPEEGHYEIVVIECHPTCEEEIVWIPDVGYETRIVCH